jgi:hypothetical protein
MSIQPESPLFDQLKNDSPVGTASTMFFEATEDYLSAIRVGLSVSRDSQTRACRILAQKAELMGSAVQMLVHTIYDDDPDTATTKLASALYVNERMQHAALAPQITGIKPYYDNEGVFLGSIITSLGASSTESESERDTLSQIAKDMVLLNAHTWMKTLRIFGVSGGS